MNNIFKRIRPAGNPIVIKKERFNSALFHPYEVDFFDSGTTALAAAILGSINHKPGLQGTPEVVLPAYGCPDLLSAIIFAGAKPVFVDLEFELPWLSLEHIQQVISNNTVAILAVRFLGISERMSILRDLAQQHRIILIEDSAQGFPQDNQATYWQGDYSILSFGRGKPISLLTGGAVLSKNNELKTLLPVVEPAENSTLAAMKYQLKAQLYNLFLNPHAYGFISKLPGLHIGETLYNPLEKFAEMPQFALEYLNRNVNNYRNYKNNASFIRDALIGNHIKTVIDLASNTNHNFKHPLLRYPLLITDKNKRDCLHRNMASLGISIMYQQPICNIKGIPDDIRNNKCLNYPNAQDFADRLITLPTHQGMTEEDMYTLVSELRKGLSA